MPSFDWLPEAALEAATDTFAASIARCRREQRVRIRRNVLDPFSLAAVAHVFGADSADDVLDYARMSAVIGCIGNALGKFHQQVLGGAEGWRDHNRGFDVICEADRVLAEVKNKHNTMNAPGRRQVEDDLKSALRQREPGWTAYLVIVIPKKPERYRKEIAPNLFEIDGASFYEVVSGRNNALHDVLDHLCATLDVSEQVADAVRQIGSLPPRL